MKYTIFNEPRPANLAEMREAIQIWSSQMDEPDLANEANVEITGPEEDGMGGTGYCAELRLNVSGESIFTSLAYPTVRALRTDLMELGIDPADIEECIDED